MGVRVALTVGGKGGTATGECMDVGTMDAPRNSGLCRRRLRLQSQGSICRLRSGRGVPVPRPSLAPQSLFFAVRPQSQALFHNNEVHPGTIQSIQYTNRHLVCYYSSI